MVRVEHKPYDTMLRCEAVMGVDSRGRRRVFALCGRHGVAPLVRRAKEAGVMVLATGGLVDSSAAAEAAKLHPCFVAARQEHASQPQPPSDRHGPVLKPWQLGHRRGEEEEDAQGKERARAGSPEKGVGFGIFGRRQKRPSQAASSSSSLSLGVQACVEVVSWRARKATDRLVTGPVVSAATCVSGSDCVAVGGPDGGTGIVDPYAKSAAGALVARLRGGHVRSVTVMAWAEGDTRLVTADEGGGVAVWERAADML